jgi:hypothetical protein
MISGYAKIVWRGKDAGGASARQADVKSACRHKFVWYRHETGHVSPNWSAKHASVAVSE